MCNNREANRKQINNKKLLFCVQIMSLIQLITIKLSNSKDILMWVAKNGVLLTENQCTIIQN